MDEIIPILLSDGSERLPVPISEDISPGTSIYSIIRILYKILTSNGGRLSINFLISSGDRGLSLVIANFAPFD